MASNSKSEQIVQAIVSILENVDSVKSVSRKLPSLDEIKQTPTTLMPMVAVTHDLPEPREWDRYRVSEMRFDSVLPLELYLYFQSQTPSETALDLSDDIWKALLVDTTLGGLSTMMEVSPGAMGDFTSVVACRFKVQVFFRHYNNGI